MLIRFKTIKKEKSDHANVQKGLVSLTKFSKIAMLHVVFGLENISEIIFQKAFFFIVWRFYLFWFLC
jgi:hypothetical protein